MNETRAVPLDQLRAAARQGDYPLPVCPGCVAGKLYPYRITITVGLDQPYYGADYLTGWVAVCVGNEDYKRITGSATHVTMRSCGFSMPLVPQLFPGRNNK